MNNNQINVNINLINYRLLLVYKNNATLIPKNTSVIVARVPVANSNKKWNKNNNTSGNNKSVSC